MNKPPTRYVLWPGYITSQHDGQSHFIGVKQLTHLYGVNMKHCVVGDKDYQARTGDIHLEPQVSGTYKITTIAADKETT